MDVFVLLISDAYAEDTGVWGVYSTREKADAVVAQNPHWRASDPPPKYGEQVPPMTQFWKIETFTVDASY